MHAYDYRQQQPGAVIRRFERLAKLTLCGAVLTLPAVMLRMPYLSIGHQAAVAFELAGIAVMSGALLVGCAEQLHHCWRQLGQVSHSYPPPRKPPEENTKPPKTFGRLPDLAIERSLARNERNYGRN